jgi:hypothetical protein
MPGPPERPESPDQHEYINTVRSTATSDGLHLADAIRDGINLDDLGPTIKEMEKLSQHNKLNYTNLASANRVLQAEGYLPGLAVTGFDKGEVGLTLKVVNVSANPDLQDLKKWQPNKYIEALTTAHLELEVINDKDNDRHVAIVTK